MAWLYLTLTLEQRNKKKHPMDNLLQTSVPREPAIVGQARPCFYGGCQGPQVCVKADAQGVEWRCRSCGCREAD